MEYANKRRDYIVTLFIFSCLFVAIAIIATGYYDTSRLYRYFTLPDNQGYPWFVKPFDYSHQRFLFQRYRWPRNVGAIIFYMFLFPYLVYLPVFSYINMNRQRTKRFILTIMTIISVLYHSMAVYIYFVVLQSPTLLAYAGLSFALSIALVLLLATYDDFFEFVRYGLKTTTY